MNYKKKSGDLLQSFDQSTSDLKEPEHLQRQQPHGSCNNHEFKQAFMWSEHKQQAQQSQIVNTCYVHQHIHLSHLQFPPALVNSKIKNHPGTTDQVNK